MGMSNEYKEWLVDKMYDVIFENHLMDNIREIYYTNESTSRIFCGDLNKESVVYYIWLDDEKGWRYRELN